MSKGTILIVVLVALAVAAAVLLLGPWSGQTPNGKTPIQLEPLPSTAPLITGIDFPSQIKADGKKVSGTVHFQNGDGGIVQAKFEVVEVKLFNPFAFDPKVKGQGEGSFQFTLFTVFPQKITLEVTLVDAQGHKSKPVKFSFEAVLP